jgi:hypothetical protein
MFSKSLNKIFNCTLISKMKVTEIDLYLIKVIALEVYNRIFEIILSVFR